MGPVELLDEIGLDIAAKVSQIMEESYGARMSGPKHAEDLVGHKFFGKKSGSGFYLHDGKKRAPNEEALEKLNIKKGSESPSRDLIEQRLIFALVNEAVRCLDEGVCGAPGKEAASQIDLASVFGIGFAPFRGGKRLVRVFMNRDSSIAGTVLQLFIQAELDFCRCIVAL